MSSACVNGIDIGFASLSYLQIGVLGVVQGITELLPISSTAHMRLVPAALGWRDPGSAFSAIMQLAALSAVVSYFFADVRGLVGGSWRAVRERNFQSNQFRLAVGIVLGTIPIGLIGVLMSVHLNTCNSDLRSLVVIGMASVVMALLLAWSERACTHRRRMEDLRLRDALLVGVAQAGALIPGVSRSGATLTGALFLNLRREDAARFSFLLGLPAITLAGLKELTVLYQAQMPLQAWLHLGFGLLVGSVSSFFAIWGLMRYLERFSTWVFVGYRALLGTLLLVGLYLGWLA